MLYWLLLANFIPSNKATKKCTFFPFDFWEACEFFQKHVEFHTSNTKFTLVILSSKFKIKFRLFTVYSWISFNIIGDEKELNWQTFLPSNQSISHNVRNDVLFIRNIEISSSNWMRDKLGWVVLCSCVGFFHHQYNYILLLLGLCTFLYISTFHCILHAIHFMHLLIFFPILSPIFTSPFFFVWLTNRWCAYGLCFAPLSAFDSCALTTSGHFPKRERKKNYVKKQNIQLCITQQKKTSSSL